MAFENKGAMAATVVVAASDSLNKAAANYICDGVADDVEIQAAIDALPAGGGTVLLLEGTYLANGIVEAGAADYNLIQSNNVRGCTTPITKLGANTIVRDNIGWKTENSGLGTVLNTTTSIVVSHGLAATPTRVLVTPAENPTNAVSFWWVDTFTATQFTIHVNADPGASNLDFHWHAQVGEG